jgi:putative membrane-bound dehydrogenase-like protein
MNALLLAALLATSADPTPKEGVLPLGKDGKPLNLDFEAGTLKDWNAEGDAFAEQPIQGDTVAVRRGDMKSDHQGKFWIGGYEKHLDKPKGTLTSVPFTVSHPWGSFLVGGGPHEKETCVEIVAGKEVIFRTAGEETETLKRVAVDLTKHIGKEIQVRVVDTHTGHWGHVNFDDFRFHSEKPAVPERAAPPADPYKYAGQKPADAAKNMTVPPGFSVKLFAGEPDVHQPIAMCTDDRGRLWVVEAYVYPKRHPAKGPLLPEAERKNGDKILIFEDTDGDGVHDKKTVFLEGLNLVSGIEYGFGGLWVGAAPYFLFIPILENDKPGEVKILLDGWGFEDTHETLNSFIWGPDGWLYGCHGVFTHSNVGKPGAKAAERQKINAGIWRYHPTKHTFEVFCHGTSNPWGLDYNQYGDFFIEACVIPHLWHMVQGGRYERQGGQHFNPYTYTEIGTIAKHRHYTGGQWNSTDRLKSDDLGGGHAHSGLLCYQGGLWPKEYHGKLFMGNIHGHRLNVDEVKPKGSSYEGDRNPDFLLSHDKTCIIVALQMAPDGNVYFTDWSDKQVCHSNNAAIWDRTNGRVFKIVHKDTKPVKGLDLQNLSDMELVKLQTSDNEWMVRHARRILQERTSKRDLKVAKELAAVLEKQVKEDKDESIRLRSVWALKAIGRFDLDGFGVGFFLGDNSSVHVRGWAKQIVFEDEFLHTADLIFATPDPEQVKHPVSRRYFASSMLRVLPARRSLQLRSITQFPEDATDPVLPHLYWYALEPLAAEKPAEALAIAASAKVPLLPLAARRVGALGTPEATAVLVDGLAKATKPEQQLAYFAGLQEANKGKRTAEAPKGWADAYAKLSKSDNAEVRNVALSLAVVYGDETALTTLATRLADTKEPAAARTAALATLLEVKYAKLPPILYGLLEEPEFRSPALRALSAYDAAGIPARVLAVYPKLTTAEKRDAIATLASRASYAKLLLAAVEAKKLPASEIPGETIRQLRNLNDKELNATIAEVWGTVRDTPADRKKMIADWQKKLTPNALTNADLGAGRAVYNKVCSQCHTLYGVGGKVGPEITGANRADINYLLENVFDPSSVIQKEYAATKLDLADGRAVIGIVKEENARTLTLLTANETLTIPVKDIDKRQPSELSMMPDDLTKPLSESQLKNLFAYLKHTQQVLPLADAENAKEFFNRKDLTNWDGDKDVWSVVDGEIVGKTEKGLKQNNFLKSMMEVTDFKLSLKVKLTPNTENSGIQFRSVPFKGHEMLGPQADIGKGWWGKLYEESGRGLLVKEGGEKFVKEGEWNDYVIEAVGPRVKMWINGELVCDYTDDKLAKRGQIAVQVHSGGPTEVRFKDLKLEVIGVK